MTLWATCQVCGQRATGYEYWRDFEERGELEEMWPGGPVVEVRTSFTRYRPVVGGSHFRLDPCGHEQPRPDEVRIFCRGQAPATVLPEPYAIEDQPPLSGPPRMLEAYRRLIRRWGSRGRKS